jgi:ADP-heptose:LPS heptosyltransferase
MLSIYGVNIYQIGHSHHTHPKFKSIDSLVGKTNNLRDYFSVVYHSSGCIGAVSLQMHVAAAFKKPCVVIAGGREDYRWEAYPNHHFLHTIGFLDCCRLTGCWKKSLKECVSITKNKMPECMSHILPQEIVNCVMRYQ